MIAERGIYNLLAEYCADFDAGAFDRWALPDIIGDMSRHLRKPLRPGPLRARE